MNNAINIDVIIKEASQRFSDYLEKNNNRKTHERFALLEEIYRNQHHFDAEMLYVRMKKSAYRVSRATVYNTLEVLLDCGLIKKYHFGENVSFFERTHGFPKHHHLVCSQCKSIGEFEYSEIQNMAVTQSEKYGFELEDFSLTLYGLCGNCRTTTE